MVQIQKLRDKGKKHLRQVPRKCWLWEPKLLTGRGKMTMRGMGGGGKEFYMQANLFLGVWKLCIKKSRRNGISLINQF